VRGNPPIPRQGSSWGPIYVMDDMDVVSDAAGHFTVSGSAGDVLVACRLAGTLDGARVNAFVTLQADRTTEVLLKAVKPAPAGSIDARIQMADRAIVLVEANGAAAKAGLQVGDQVIAVDGISVTDLDGMSTMQVITQRPPGSAAVLTVQRGEATRTLSVVVHG